MKKNILQHSATNNLYPKVEPAKKFVPDWYKDSPKFFDGVTEKNVKSLPIPMSFKACSVFSETLFKSPVVTSAKSSNLNTAKELAFS